VFSNREIVVSKRLAYISPVRPIRKYGSLCWDPYREGQINALDRVQKKAAKFANHTNDSVWETLAQRRQIAHICSHFKAYTGELPLRTTRDRFGRTMLHEQGYHGRKIRVRKQRRDMGKCSFVNRAIKPHNLLPAEALATLTCKSHIFERGLGK
jgi:hypothetical protein